MDASFATALRHLAGVCESSASPDELLSSALPVVVHIGGASTGIVCRTNADGAHIVAGAGAQLPAADLRPLPGVGPLVETTTPAAWSAAGVVAVRARALPGPVGTLALTWTAPPTPEGADLAVACALLVAALGRLVAQETLADLTARVDNAQQLANMGDYDWHIASDTNRWSDQLYRIYGHEPQSFNASYERFLGHIHPEDRERIQGIHQAAYASGEPYQMVERIVRPDGEVRYLSSNGQVVRDATDTPVRMRGTCIDITDRVLAEQERERTAARFRGLVESAPESILVLARDGAIVQANSHASELLGGDPIGHDIAEIVTSIEPGTAVPARRFDGATLALDVTTAQLGETGPDATPGLVAVFLRDATPQLESEALAATLREAQVRRRQALEINDNVVQGLTVAVNAVQQGNTPAATMYLERTLGAARQMMNDWLEPLDGADLQPGDLVRSGPSRLDAPPEPVRAAPVRVWRVLLADDYDDVRRLLRVQFERMDGFQVVGEAADGQEAVELAESLQPDLVLLDLAMPVMDGLQALPRICTAVPGVRVVVLSGFDQGIMAQKALAAGAVRYVEKGIRLNLAEILEGVLTAH